MSEDHSLLERGPEAVIAAVAADGEALNVEVLAQACARRTRESRLEREAILWGEATITCYRAAAEDRESGFDRQGSEIGLFGVMAALILRWGPSDDGARDLGELESWLFAPATGCAEPSSLRRSLAGGAGIGMLERENAILTKERLSAIGVPLLDAGLLSEERRPWFRAAGLIEGSE